MTIPNKLCKKWETELKSYGLMDSAEEMGISYRTINRAINSKQCTQKVFDTINDYLLKKREANEKAIAAVIQEQ